MELRRGDWNKVFVDNNWFIKEKFYFKAFLRNINRQSVAMSLYSFFNHSFPKESYTANLPGLGG